MLLSGAHAVFEDTTISLATRTSGIEVLGSATLRDCKVMWCGKLRSLPGTQQEKALTAGAAVAVTSPTSHLLAVRTVFSYNRVHGGDSLGGAIFVAGSAILQDCTVSFNHGHRGGGVYVSKDGDSSLDSDSTLHLKGSTAIYLNEAREGEFQAGCCFVLHAVV